MAEQLLEQVRDIVDGQIVRHLPNSYQSTIASEFLANLVPYVQDFEGQKLAEILATVLLCVVGVCTLLISGGVDSRDEASVISK